MMLLMLAFMISMASIAILLHSINSTAMQVAKEKTTSQALAQAKQALIGWSVGRNFSSANDGPGILPCPDTSNGGTPVSSGSNCVGYVGRLPWKTLGLTDFRDADGECLWYALSPVFRNVVSISSRATSSYRLNSNTAGTTTIKDRSGAILANQVVAVVIAPGSPLSGQDRSGGAGTICGGNTTASNYLEIANGINNATGNFDGTNLYFVSGASDSGFNDKLIYITMEDLYTPLRKRIAAEMYGTSSPTYGLLWYYTTYHAYPWAADASYDQQAGRMSGNIPYDNLNFTVSALNQWLTNNAWWSLVTYSLGSDFAPGTSYPQQCGSGCLTVRGQQTQASVTVGGGGSSWTARVCATNALTTSCPSP